MPLSHQHELSHGLVADTRLPMTTAELELVDLFADFAKRIGMPASAGGIYGLLFAVRIPLHMNQIKESLGISLGATSQGLKLLRSAGFVQLTYHPGDRRDHYQPHVDVRTLIEALVRHNVYPSLADGARRVGLILTRAEKEKAAPALRARLKLLATWMATVQGLFERWEEPEKAELLRRKA